MVKSETLRLSDQFYVDASGIHGKGLYAKVALKKGSYLGTYKGPERRDIDNSGPHVLWAEMEDGSWLGRDGRNILRYLNHSVKPCAEFDGGRCAVEAVGIAVLRMAPVVHDLRRVVAQHG